MTSQEIRTFPVSRHLSLNSAQGFSNPATLKPRPNPTISSLNSWNIFVRFVRNWATGAGQLNIIRGQVIHSRSLGWLNVGIESHSHARTTGVERDKSIVFRPRSNAFQYLQLFVLIKNESKSKICNLDTFVTPPSGFRHCTPMETRPP